MKFLILGAGPIGSLYAGKLAVAGHDVELAARGERLAALARGGLVLAEGASGREERPPARIVAAGDPAAPYDAAIVAVRSERLRAALPELAALRGARRIVTMVNQPDGGDAALAAIGGDRLVLGFPGATGSIRADGAVVYGIVPGYAQRTTFGDPRGGQGEGARLLAESCAGAGFPTALSRDMPAWLRTHAAFIGPVGAALLVAGGLEGLAASGERVALLVDAAREGLAALEASGSRIEPRRFGLLAILPRAFLLAALPRLLRSRAARKSVGGHAAVSREEMLALVTATVRRAEAAGLPCPAALALARSLG